MAVHRRSKSAFTRGLDVLIACAGRGQATVPELAEELGIPVSTTYRYVRVLREYALVEEDQGVYVPGWRLLELSGQHLGHARLAELGGHHLRTLAHQTGETAVLAVRAGSHAVCLRQHTSSAPDHYAFRINELLPLHAGAGQRVLLAFAPSPVVSLAAQAMVRYSASTPTADELPPLLAPVRRQGFAVSRGEFKDGAVAVAVPVYADGEVVCSLTVAGPAERCDDDSWLRRTVRLLKTSASALETQLDEE